MHRSHDFDSARQHEDAYNGGSQNSGPQCEHLDIPTAAGHRFGIGQTEQAKHRPEHGYGHKSHFPQHCHHYDVLPSSKQYAHRSASINQRVAEYTLISAILWLSIFALIGVNGYYRMARVETAYQLERV